MRVVYDLTREDTLALEAYLVRGLNFRQVYEETGVTRGRLRGLLEREDVKEIIGQLQSEFQQELNAMQEIVLNQLRDLLMHEKAEVRLAAIDKWARMNGKFRDNINIGRESAEDVAKKLMEAGVDGEVG